MTVTDGRSRYTVQILMAERVALDPRALHDRLCEWRPDIEILGDRALFAIRMFTAGPHGPSSIRSRR